ncbi:MAG: MFS transporter [Pseudomonadales bacterium]|nr:MFS transporter [Pseudomonadales bacterium]
MSRHSSLLRQTLTYSQKEAVASATMTATGDNFFNAFAVYLQASTMQMGWLTAFPQLLGAAMQLLSVWISAWFPCRQLVTVVAVFQAVVVLLIAMLAVFHPGNAMILLIVLAVLYHSAMNLIQPQWRAWMGSLVPKRRRGLFFASRTRLTMGTSLAVFIGGGALLYAGEKLQVPWLGFTILFGVAACGRLLSSRFLWLMHDPAPHHTLEGQGVFIATLKEIRKALHDDVFRHYSFFVAGMQGMVAISAPFFAVYMLKELDFNYFQFSLNSVASIATQFLSLKFWGRLSDRYGNRLVMLSCSSMIPVIPALWLVSPDFYYLFLLQMLSGLFWSGFTLSTANYLYDIRPHRTNFATYAAAQSGIGAIMVFIGAAAGGLLASHADSLRALLPFTLSSSLFIVFLTSGIMRALVLLWFIPRAVEPHIRPRPRLLQIIYRVSRFNPISGVVLDWLTVTERKPRDQPPEE